MKRVIFYRAPNGKEPVKEWLSGLRDGTAQTRILHKLSGLSVRGTEAGKKLAAGLWELRLFFGPGYRVYFTERNGELIILLCGGDKSTQTQDIAKAKMCLEDIRRRSND